MTLFQCCLLGGAAAFTAACLWAWEQLDRIDREHWYQVTGKRPTPHQPEPWTKEGRRAALLERAMIEANQKKGSPEGWSIARAHPQNQQDAKKSEHRGGQSE
jgi:hypothetical protein